MKNHPPLLGLVTIMTLLGVGWLVVREVQASFGVYPKNGTFTGYVFEDLDSDGVRDVGEPNYNFTLNPYYSITYQGPENGNLLVNGAVSPTKNLVSNEVRPGLYTVNFGTLPAGFMLTTSPSQQVNVPPGGVAPEVLSFGIKVGPPRIEGVVCDDSNNNNSCDAGEELSGITVGYTTPTLGSNFVTTPTTQIASCSGCNYTTMENTPSLYPGTNLVAVTIPLGKILKSPTQPQQKELVLGEHWQVDFVFGGETDGRIGGYLWNDYNQNSLYDEEEDETILNDQRFTISVWEGGHEYFSAPPHPAAGTYLTDLLTPASDYNVNLELPWGYCLGDLGVAEVGWNDNESVYEYAVKESPLETGSVIEVTGGAVSTVNLGVLSDYDLSQDPPTDVILTPPDEATVRLIIDDVGDATPCWGGGDVSVAFDDSGWPPGLTFSTTPPVPALLDPNSKPDFYLTISADSTVHDGIYPYEYIATNPFRGKVLGGYNVVVGLRSWLQLVDLDVFSAYTGIEPPINFVLPQTPCCGYSPYLVTRSTSAWGGGDLGGMAVAVGQIDIAVTTTAGDPAASSRSWVLNQYTGDLGLPLSELALGLVSTECDFDQLVPGGACQYEGKYLPDGYDLTGVGVAVVYVPDDLFINTDFRSDAVNERVIIVVAGEIKIAGSVGVPYNPPSTYANIEAVLITLDGWDIILDSNDNLSEQLRLTGGLYASGHLENMREVQESGGQVNTFPSLVVSRDPFYYHTPIYQFSKVKLHWREVNFMPTNYD